MKSNIYKLLGVPSVSPNRHYWIIRTNDGLYYEDFVLHNYIAIAWDYVTLKLLNNRTDDEIKRLIESYEKSTPFDPQDDDDEGTSKGKITAIFNKVQRFVFEMDKGDIVLVPSKESNRITIAEVIGDVYEDSNYVEDCLLNDPESENMLCPFYKRRKIKHCKTIEKSQMDIYLSKGFNSHHALSSMDEYSPFIDRTIYGIYSKNNELHTTITAGHPNGLTLKELVELSQTLEKSASSIAEQCGLSFDSSEIAVKLNIHSPGLIELIGYLSGGGIILSLLIFSLNNYMNGGKLNLSFKRNGETGDIDFSVDSESPGSRGSKHKEKAIEFEHKEKLLQLTKDLGISSPDVISAIINDEKVTPQMISEAQRNQGLPFKSENSM